jgi:hypothetical protein
MKDSDWDHFFFAWYILLFSTQNPVLLAPRQLPIDGVGRRERRGMVGRTIGGRSVEETGSSWKRSDHNCGDVQDLSSMVMLKWEWKDEEMRE